MSSRMTYPGVMSSKTVLVVVLSSFCVCVLSTDSTQNPERYSKSTLYVNMRDPQVVRMEGKQEILRFGDKLRRKEVISRRKDTSIVGDSGELEIQLPDGGVKAPNGKTLNKMVIRTFKTTTTASTSTSTTTEVPKSEHYYNHYYPNRNKNKSKFTSTTTKPQTLSSAEKYIGEASKHVSLKKSTTERPFATSTTSEIQSAYSFPSFPKKEQNQKKNGGTTMRQYILRSSLSTKATTPYTPRTTFEATTTTTAPTVQETNFPSTEQPAVTTLQEDPETTPVVSTSTSSSSSSTSPGRPVKVVSKTVSTVITTLTDSSYVPASSTPEPVVEEPKPSRKPIHYILAVIGPSKVPEEQQFEDDTTTVPPEGEQSSTFSVATSAPESASSLPVQNEVTTSTPGPYDHLQTIEIPASAITDNSPPFDVIPSVGNAQPHYRPFSATRAPPTRFNYFDTQNYKQDFRPRDQLSGESPRLIPLQTVVSYTPDNSRNINRLIPPQEHSSSAPSNPSASRSPFVSSKTVLYYTQVSPKDGTNSGDFPKFSANSVPSLNSLISGSSSDDQRNRIVSSSSASSSSSSNGLNAVPARSFYLDNLRLPVPSSVFGKPIPLVLNYSSV